MPRMANARLPPPVEGSCRWLLLLLEDCFRESEREREPALRRWVALRTRSCLLQWKALAAGCQRRMRTAGGTSQPEEDADDGWRSPVRLHALLADRHNVTVPLPRLIAALNTGVARGVLETNEDLYRLAEVRQQPQPQRQRVLGEAPRQQPRRRPVRGRRRRGRRPRPRRWRRRNRHLPCVICGLAHHENICEAAPARAGAAADGQCSICYDAVRPERGRGRARLRCGHCFHYKCAVRWGRTRRICPLCRQAM